MLLGIIVNKKISDRVEVGEILAYIHVNDEEKGNQAVQDLMRAYRITSNKTEKPKHILEIIE